MAPFRSPLLLGLVVLVGLAVVMAIPILPSKPEHTEVDFEAAPELNTLPAEASVPVSLPSDEDNVASAAPLPEEDSPRFEAIKNATAATNATNSSSSTNHTKPASTPAPTAKPTLPGTAPPSAIKGELFDHDCMYLGRGGVQHCHLTALSLTRCDGNRLHEVDRAERHHQTARSS